MTSTYDCPNDGVSKPERRKFVRGPTDDRVERFFMGFENVIRNLSPEDRDPYWAGWLIAMRDEFAKMMRDMKAPTVTLTARQLANALELAAPDFAADPDQREAQVSIAWTPAGTCKDDDGTPEPAGYRAWFTEHPEEGSIPLVDAYAGPLLAIGPTWSVFNGHAEVVGGLALRHAADYMTPERIERGWTMLSVIATQAELDAATGTQAAATDDHCSTCKGSGEVPFEVLRGPDVIEDGMRNCDECAGTGAASAAVAPVGPASKADEQVSDDVLDGIAYCHLWHIDLPAGRRAMMREAIRTAHSTPAPLPIVGVRVDRDKVIVSVKGGNDAARHVCGALIAAHIPQRAA